MTQPNAISLSHSPGPWSIAPVDAHGNDLDGISDRFTASIRANSKEAFAQWGLMGDFRGCIVAYVACNPALKQTDPEYASVEANARLLAAAPELEEAVRFALSVLQANPAEMSERMAILKCLEVLAKVEGTSTDRLAIS